MGFSSRPVSSPGRNENPPLLMRFLRTNVGSRSRGRSRTRKKALFFRRKSTTETQEPSSPKVTCMGQVRIKRSKKPKPGMSRVNGGVTESRRGRCSCVKNGFFSGKSKAICFSSVWRKWKSFSNVSFSRKSEKKSTSSAFTVELEETEKIRREEVNLDKSVTATPPRNAFMLTRSRSAAYRSSSLINTLCEEEVEDSSETKEAHFRRHDDDVIISQKNASLVSGELKKRSVLGCPRRQRIVLTRCKSEPARIGEKLVPEYQRLGFT